MTSFSQILLLSFIVSVWTAPHLIDIDASSETIEVPEPTLLDDVTINDQKISIIEPVEPIAEILDESHRGSYAIQQIADRGYQKLVEKVPLKFQYNTNFLGNNPSIPTSSSTSKLGVPIFLFQRMPTNGLEYPNRIVSSGRFLGQLAVRVNPLPVRSVKVYKISSSSHQSSDSQSVSQRLTIHPNRFNENRPTRQTIENSQAFNFPPMIEEFSSGFTNQDSAKGTTNSPGLSDESSESGGNASGSTMTTSAAEELQATTVIPSESQSTTTFETPTNVYTINSNDEEIMLSTTPSELLDKNAEIDEAVAFNIDGDIPSTQESATQSSEINNDNFYVIYGTSALTK